MAASSVAQQNVGQSVTQMAASWTPGTLIRWRKANGMTQTDLGERLGITSRTVIALEQGASELTKTYRLALAALVLAVADSKCPRNEMPSRKRVYADTQWHMRAIARSPSSGALEPKRELP